MTQKYTSEPLDLHSHFAALHVQALTAIAEPKKDFERAYLEVQGLDTIGATYTGRIFFNNPEADENTPMTPESGFAGSFTVFGHGGCGGEPGHCERETGVRPFDKRPRNVAHDGYARAAVTDALREAIAHGEKLTFTIVPVILSANEKCDTDKPLKFKDFDISLRYRKPDGALQRLQLLHPF